MDFFPGEARMLDRMKKIQGNADDYVYVDIEEGTGFFCKDISKEAVEEALLTKKGLSSLRVKNIDDLNDLLRHAQKAGYLERPVMIPVYHVTFEGRNAKAVLRMEQRRMIMNGVLFPVIVSVLTTLFTLWLNGVIHR